jgi:hypothetical protein
MKKVDSMKTLKLPMRRTASQGNALMEYVVPAAVILLSAGVLVTVTDATEIMADYFMSASGHTRASSLEGKTFKTLGLAENSYGNTDNGLKGFNSFAKVLDGQGASTGEDGGGFFYLDSPSRSGARPTPPNTEQLFADTSP